MADKKWIDARFGNNWIEHAKKKYTIDEICEIALNNGRIATEVNKLFNDEAIEKIAQKLYPDNFGKQVLVSEIVLHFLSLSRVTLTE